MVDRETAIFVTYLFAWMVIAYWLMIWIAFLTSIFLARIWIESPIVKKKTGLVATGNEPPDDDPLLGQYPGVSILKPLTGSDTTLYANLETWFKLHYPHFELMFCVHDIHDDSVEIVESLMQKYPQVNAKLVVSGNCSVFGDDPSKTGLYKAPSVDDVEKQKSSTILHRQSSITPSATNYSNIINPKIRNILPAYESAQYELIFISDCNIEAEPDTILDAVSKMDSQVASVCQMHFVKDPPAEVMSFGSILNKVYFGTQNAKCLLFLNLISMPSTVSAAMLLRKSALEECGGLAAFGSYLAEDLHIGVALAKRGWKHRLGRKLAWQNPAKTQVCDVFNRIIRWKRLRQTTSPILILLDPLTECMLLGLAGSWALTYLFPLVPSWGIFLAHCLLWFFADFTLLKTINKHPLRFPKFAYCLAWLVREISAPVLHIISLLSRRVVWRDQGYFIRFGGKTERIPLPEVQNSTARSGDPSVLATKTTCAVTLNTKDVPVVDGQSGSSAPSASKLQAFASPQKPRRHQQQTSSPPTLCAVNA